MKKLWLGILVGLLCVSMIGCGKGENSSKENTTPPNTVQKNPSEALPFTYATTEGENKEIVVKTDITEISLIDIDNELRDRIERMNEGLSLDIVNRLKTDYKIIKISAVSNEAHSYISTNAEVKAYLGDQQLESLEKMIRVGERKMVENATNSIGLVIKKEDAEKSGLQVRIGIRKNGNVVERVYFDVA